MVEGIAATSDANELELYARVISLFRGVVDEAAMDQAWEGVMKRLAAHELWSFQNEDDLRGLSAVLLALSGSLTQKALPQAWAEVSRERVRMTESNAGRAGLQNLLKALPLLSADMPSDAVAAAWTSLLTMMMSGIVDEDVIAATNLARLMPANQRPEAMRQFLGGVRDYSDQTVIREETYDKVGAALAGVMQPDQALSVWKSLMTTLNRPLSNRGGERYLTETLGALVDRLPPDSRVSAWTQVIDLMASGRLSGGPSLVPAASNLARSLLETQKAAAWKAAITVKPIGSSGDLPLAIAAVAASFQDVSLDGVWTDVQRALARGDRLEGARAVLSERLSLEQPDQVWVAVLDAIVTTDDSENLLVLGRAGMRVAFRLSEQQKQVAVTRLVDALKKATDSAQIIALCTSARALQPLTESDSRSLWKYVQTAMEKTDRGDPFRGAARQALSLLPGMPHADISTAIWAGLEMRLHQVSSVYGDLVPVVETGLAFLRSAVSAPAESLNRGAQLRRALAAAVAIGADTEQLVAVVGDAQIGQAIGDTVSEIVDLLKYPTVSTLMTERLVDLLRTHGQDDTPRFQGDLGAALDWLDANGYSSVREGFAINPCGGMEKMRLCSSLQDIAVP